MAIEPFRMKAKKVEVVPKSDPLPRCFAIWFGCLLALAQLKFVNPAVFDKAADWPTNGYEWAINPWPIVIGYGLLAVTPLFGIFVARRDRSGPRWLIILPLVWLGWQFVAATQTTSAELTRATLKHFAACVVCFYVGLFALTRVRNPFLFLMPTCIAFAVTIAIGIEQRFGGLETSRKYFFTYVYPEMASVPEDYLKRLSSDRIFATQFYPNALAGIVLSLLPATLAIIWRSERKLTMGARAFLVGLVGASALACLYWSGSKGGWLLMLLLGLVALLHLPFPKKLKFGLLGVILIIGLAGFVLKYASFFQRGATSVSARFDYWEAAVKTGLTKPIFGTGPGTFAVAYKAIKRPESEMARLTHNDYLQQVSDSGWVGFVIYMVLVVGTLVRTRPHAEGQHFGGELRFSMWLGLLGWSLQSLLEFGLYIPSLAWCAFAWMGWLLGTAKPIDNPNSGNYAGDNR